MRASDPDCLGAVIAGGLGRRIGRDKATIPLAGKPLISYPLAAIQAAGLEPIVVAKADSELPALAAPVMTEPAEPRHPLRGIVAALECAADRRARAVVVLACDMPLVPAEMIAWLAGHHDPLVLPRVAGHPQPLAARYGTELLSPLREALNSERLGSLTGLVMQQNPRLVDETELARFGDPARILHNVNTAADLERATVWLPA